MRNQPSGISVSKEANTNRFMPEMFLIFMPEMFLTFYRFLLE
jgi:hypothetical protein